jgi:hypothetical protein
MGIGFDEFKSYFEFGLEVTGVVGGIGTAIYKFDCINALFRIARGRANSADETLAIEAIRESGGVGQQFMRAIARAMGKKGHKQAAARLNRIRGQAGGQAEGQAEERPASPGQMV